MNKILYRLLAGIMLAFAFPGADVRAAVSVTAATGGTNLTNASWTTLGNIVITEGVSTDYAASQTNTTLILTCPSNYEFKSATGSCTISGPDLTGASISTWNTNDITVTISTNGTPNALTDILTITGLQIRATAAAMNTCSSNAGSITRSSGNAGNATITGITNDVTNFGSLTTSYTAPTVNSVSITWGPVVTGMDACGVVATAVYNSELYVGGCFNNASGVSANYIAKWNGTSWSAVGSNTFDNTVNALCVYNGELYAGGSFSTLGGAPADYIARWNGTTWSSVGSGTNADVMSLGLYSGKIYAGGAFTNAGGVPANYIASWNGTSWAALGAGVNGNVNSICTYGTDLVAGGSFSMAAGSFVYYIAKWNGAAWSMVGPGLNNFVKVLNVYGSDLYAGGQFTGTFGNAVSANYIAKWNGSAWSSLGTGTNNFVEALTVYNSELYIGGWFTAVNCNPASRIAKWDGTNWWTLGAGLNNWVFTIAAYNSEIYAGGFFFNSGGPDVNYIARFTVTLPVGLLSFTGKNNGNENVFEWITASEVNNDRFTIEKSTDGINFSEIGNVKGKEQPSATNHYRFIEFGPSPGMSYYRLRQTDYDGVSVYSNVISLNTESGKKLTAEIYPMPVVNDLNFVVASDEYSELNIEVTDIRGKILMHDKTIASMGINSYSLPARSLSPGMYFLKINEKGNSCSQVKFIKE